MEKTHETFSVDPEQIDQVRNGTLNLAGLDKAEKLELYLHW
jgi:hypothetical protein